MTKKTYATLPISDEQRFALEVRIMQAEIGAILQEKVIEAVKRVCAAHAVTMSDVSLSYEVKRNEETGEVYVVPRNILISFMRVMASVNDVDPSDEVA